MVKFALKHILFIKQFEEKSLYLVLLLKVCNGLLRDGVVAIINLDSKDSTSSYQIKKMSEINQIPYISAYWNQYYRDPDWDEYSINIYPNWKHISLAFIDLINYCKWGKFILVYEDSSGELTFYNFHVSKTKVT